MARLSSKPAARWLAVAAMNAAAAGESELACLREHWFEADGCGAALGLQEADAAVKAGYRARRLMRRRLERQFDAYLKGGIARDVSAGPDGTRAR